MKKYTLEMVVGSFVFAGILGIAYMTVTFAEIDYFGKKTYPLTAKFNTISGLKTDATVEMVGMKIGKVERFIMDQENQQAIVEMRIDDGILIYEDAIASIKTRGLIGDKFINIDPGGAEELLKPGGMITETESPVDLQELISKYAFGEVNEEEE